jgi:hypothetical protein
MLILALFFITHSWIWFVIGGVLCAVLGSMARPILASMGYVSTCGSTPVANRQPQPYYQPEQAYRPPEAPYQPYEQGYQPEQPETYQEGGQQHQYPPTAQYEEPQAQYPQQMPPQQ